MQPLDVAQRRAHHLHRVRPLGEGGLQRPVGGGDIARHRRHQRLLQPERRALGDAGDRVLGVHPAALADIERELLQLPPQQHPVLAEPLRQPVQRRRFRRHAQLAQDRADGPRELRARAPGSRRSRPPPARAPAGRAAWTAPALRRLQHHHPGPGPASAALAAAAKPSPASRTRTSGRPPVSGTLAASAASRPGSRQPSRGTSTSRIASPPATARASRSARSRISPGSSPCSSTTRQSRGSDRKASTRRAIQLRHGTRRRQPAAAALLPLAAQLHRHAAEDVLRKLLDQPLLHGVARRIRREELQVGHVEGVERPRRDGRTTRSAAAARPWWRGSSFPSPRSAAG